MATYEFYSSTSTDTRSYGGAEFARFFRALRSSGVEYGNQNGLAVTAQTPAAMAVNVASGAAWLYGYWFSSDDVSGNTIEAADASWNRIDRVVVRNTIASGSALYVIKGTPAASPTAPALTTDGATYYDVPLAQVLVSAGVTDISGNEQTLITDDRTYSTLNYIAQSSILVDANPNMGNYEITELADGMQVTELINKGQADNSANFSDVPTGSVVAFGTASVPGGYLLCDGTAVSRTTYANLFSVIGTLHGTGDGTTTFNVPDMATRIPVGYDSADTSFNTVGKTGGASTITLTEAELPAHTHSGIYYAYNPAWEEAYPTAQKMGTGGATGSTGGGGAHNNLAPYIKLAWGIRI